MATVLTQNGEEWIVDLMGAVLTSSSQVIGSGTGAGTAAKADTTLFTEVTEPRAATTRSEAVADKIRWVGTQSYTAAKTVTNAGNFITTSGGLIVKGDFAGIAVGNGDRIEFTLDLEIT